MNLRTRQMLAGLTCFATLTPAIAQNDSYFPPADKDGGWRTLTTAAKIRSVAGMDLSRLDQRGAVDDTPLHIAARKGDLGDIDVLIAHGADINVRGDLGNTPLHSAALTGQADVVRMLLELGAGPALRNELSDTALQVARNGGHEAVFSILCSR